MSSELTFLPSLRTIWIVLPAQYSTDVSQGKVLQLRF